MGCSMSRVRAGRGRSSDAQVEEVIVKTLESTPKDATHWSTRSMAARSGSRRRRFRGSGGRSGCSRTARRRGSSPRIRSSSTRSATSSGCISIRPSARSCCASMRSPRSRRLTGPRRSCRCCPAPPSARPTTTSARAPRASTPRLDIATGKVIGSLHSRHRAIEFKKFLADTRPRGPGRARRARDPRQLLDPQDPGDPEAGCSLTPASCCTSPRPRARG